MHPGYVSPFHEIPKPINSSIALLPSSSADPTNPLAQVKGNGILFSEYYLFGAPGVLQSATCLGEFFGKNVSCNLPLSWVVTPVFRSLNLRQ